MKRVVWVTALCTLLLQASGVKPYRNLELDEALQIAKKENLEINIAEFDRRVAELGVKVATGYHLGKLDATLMGLRSNDAGNVFGFKLQSREATFNDFGFDQFLDAFGQAMIDPTTGMPGDFNTFMQNFGNPQAKQMLLDTKPDRLNYPDARNHFDLKLTYMIPLFTGFKLTKYRQIAKMMKEMAEEDKKKVEAEKLYQVRKTFYDISLLRQFITDLTTIRENIGKLKKATIEMRKEGYAKKTDILEVESKLSNVERMLRQAKANKELSYHFLSFLLNHPVKSIRSVALSAADFQIPLETVLENNRDIKKAKLGLKIQSNMVGVARASFLPEVGAFAEYGSSDDKLFNDFKDHDRYTVGVQAKWNLFSGGSDAAKLEQEKLKRLKVKEQVELAKKGIALQYRKIRTEIRNLDSQIESLGYELKLAKEIFFSYQERYKEGLASINDVVIKQSLQLEKLLKLEELRTRRNEKILELHRLAY